MMRPLLFRLSLALTLVGISCGNLYGHVVSQLYGEWHPEINQGVLEIQFEAGFADADIRNDPSAPAPTREWLLEQGSAGWKKLKIEAERYLRESLVIFVDNRELVWNVDFPDFRSIPPDFPKLLTDGAYLRMNVPIDVSDEKAITIKWQEDKLRPDLILKMPGTPAEYVTFKPGDQHEIKIEDHHSAEKIHARGPYLTSLIQGFLHVVPQGWDHVLFVLGLFFYRREWRALLHQSLAFTIAHTVTLGLAASGVVHISGNWVEPMIALSLVAVALENLRASKEKNGRVRLVIVFAFGLIHGLGFAGALSVWLKPGEGFLPSLLLANFGVELAQASLLATAWMLTIGWHQTYAYRWVRLMSCLSIAAIGSWWAYQRVVG